MQASGLEKERECMDIQAQSFATSHQDLGANLKHCCELFSTNILRDLLSQDQKKYDQYLESLHTRNLTLRPLQFSDFSKGYMKLLAQHTHVGDVTQEKFEQQFNIMKSYQNIYYIVVIEDLSSKKIVATGTLEIEHKFIHSTALRGRLEDVVVDQETQDPQYRYSENNLASVVLDVLTTMGKVLGCYKISLESEDHLLSFYNKFGYQADEGQNYMVVRYRD